MIFDDIESELAAFKHVYTNLGYEVIPVLTVDRENIDNNARLRSSRERYGIYYGVFGHESLKKLLDTHKPDVILSDNSFPTGFGGGPALVRAAQKLRPGIPCVVHSGTRSDDRLEMKEGYALISKNASAGLVDQYFRVQLAAKLGQSPA